MAAESEDFGARGSIFSLNRGSNSSSNQLFAGASASPKMAIYPKYVFRRIQWRQNMDSCCERTGRFFSHIMFFLTFTWYLIWSSLPRFLCLTNIAFVSALSVIYLRKYPGFSLSLYSYTCVDIWALSFTRCIVFFSLFAYRNQSSSSSVWATAWLGGISALYLALKLLFTSGENVPSSLRFLLISDLIFTCAEILAFAVVRKRKIRVAPPQRPSRVRGRLENSGDFAASVHGENAIQIHGKYEGLSEEEEIELEDMDDQNRIHLNKDPSSSPEREEKSTIENTEQEFERESSKEEP